MNLNFDLSLTKGYKSKSQIPRVLTENWVKNNGYCPNCNQHYLIEFENNKPVADFFCSYRSEQYELKSKKGIKIGKQRVF
ncbi:MAG: DpnI domain-containing protein [Marinirhabdus sp.]